MLARKLGRKAISQQGCFVVPVGGSRRPFAGIGEALAGAGGGPPGKECARVPPPPREEQPGGHFPERRECSTR